MINLERAAIFFKETGERMCVNEFINSRCQISGRNYIDLFLFNDDGIYLSRSTNRCDKDGDEIFTGMLVSVRGKGLYKVDFNEFGDVALFCSTYGDELDMQKASNVGEYKIAGSWLDEKGME